MRPWSPLRSFDRGQGGLGGALNACTRVFVRQAALKFEIRGTGENFGI